MRIHSNFHKNTLLSDKINNLDSLSSPWLKYDLIYNLPATTLCTQEAEQRYCCGFMVFCWKYEDLAAWAQPSENKVDGTVFQATSCHCLAVRQGGGVSPVTLALPCPCQGFYITWYIILTSHFMALGKLKSVQRSRGSVSESEVRFSDEGAVTTDVRSTKQLKVVRLVSAHNELPWSLFNERQDTVLLFQTWDLVLSVFIVPFMCIS